MLKLKKLILNNFMCVEHAELNFDDGVNLIVGSNGQGKSTVLQAVTLCLLEDKRSDRYQEFIMLGKDNCSVTLEAEIKGGPLKIAITLSDKTSGLGRTAEYGGKTYVNSQVTDLLDSFDIAYYADIIMSMQNEGDITKLKPSEREQFLQKLFQFDFTEKIEKLKEDLAGIKESIDYQTAQINFNTRSIDERKKEIREVKPLSFKDEEIQELNDSVVSINNELTKTAVLIKEKDTVLSRKSDLQKDMYNVKQQITKLEHDIELIESNKGMIDTLVQKSNEYVVLNNTLTEEKKNYVNNIKDLNDELSMEIEEKDSISAEITAKHDEYLKKSSELNELNVQLAGKIADVQHAQKHMDMIKLGTCPECGHAFDRADQSKYNDALNTAIKIKDEIESIKNQRQSEASFADAEVKAMREKLRNKEIEISNTKKDISTLEYRVQNVDNQITSNLASKERLDEQINQYSSNASDISSIKEQIVGQKERLAGIESEISECDLKINSFGEVTDKYTENQSKLRDVQQKISDYNAEVSQNNIILQNNDNIRKSIEDMTRKIEESKASVETYRHQKATYDDAIVLLDKTFPAWLILKTCQMLEHEMNSFIQVVFPQMEVKLFQNKRGVEFFYTTDKNNGRIHTKENLLNAKMASGFEKAILSIAFKVALCRAYNLRFAFMDEIDQAGTDENSEHMFKAILANDLFDQLFIISHKPMVRDIISSFAPSLRTFYVHKGKFWTNE